MLNYFSNARTKEQMMNITQGILQQEHQLKIGNLLAIQCQIEI